MSGILLQAEANLLAAVLAGAMVAAGTVFAVILGFRPTLLRVATFEVALTLFILLAAVAR